MTSTITNQPKRSTAKTDGAKRAGSSINVFARDVTLATCELTENAPEYLLTAEGDYILLSENAITNQSKR